MAAFRWFTRKKDKRELTQDREAGRSPGTRTSPEGGPGSNRGPKGRGNLGLRFFPMETWRPLPHPYGLYRQEYGEGVDLVDAKGSPYRGFRNIVATGMTATLVVPFGGAATSVSIPVREEGVVSHVVISSSISAGMALTGLSHNGDPLTVGQVPVQLFDAASEVNPYVGHWSALNDDWTFTFQNNDGATNSNVQITLVHALGDPRRSKGGWHGSHVRPRITVGGTDYRSLIAIGASAASYAGGLIGGGGGEQVYAFPTPEPGFLGNLVFGTPSTGLGLSRLELNNNRLVSGITPSTAFSHLSKFNAVFGQFYTNGMTLEATVRNDGAGGVRNHMGFAIL